MVNKKRINPVPGKVMCLIRVGKHKWVIGFNSDKTSPRFMKRKPDGHVTHSQCAEMRALQLAKRAGGKIREVIVMRWTKRGRLAMAKPCPACQEMLWIAGVRARDVMYSNGDGRIVGFR